MQDDASCQPCPVIVTAWDKYHALLYVLFAVVALVAVVYASLLLLVFVRGGTLAGGAVRMLGLFVWGLQAAQVGGGSPLCRCHARCCG